MIMNPNSSKPSPISVLNLSGMLTLRYEEYYYWNDYKEQAKEDYDLPKLVPTVIVR